MESGAKQTNPKQERLNGRFEMCAYKWEDWLTDWQTDIEFVKILILVKWSHLFGHLCWFYLTCEKKKNLLKWRRRKHEEEKNVNIAQANERSTTKWFFKRKKKSMNIFTIYSSNYLLLWPFRQTFDVLIYKYLIIVRCDVRTCLFRKSKIFTCKLNTKERVNKNSMRKTCDWWNNKKTSSNEKKNNIQITKDEKIAHKLAGVRSRAHIH